MRAYEIERKVKLDEISFMSKLKNTLSNAKTAAAAIVSDDSLMQLIIKKEVIKMIYSFENDTKGYIAANSKNPKIVAANTGINVYPVAFVEWAAQQFSISIPTFLSAASECGGTILNIIKNYKSNKMVNWDDNTLRNSMESLARAMLKKGYLAFEPDKDLSKETQEKIAKVIGQNKMDSAGAEGRRTINKDVSGQLPEKLKDHFNRWVEDNNKSLDSITKQDMLDYLLQFGATETQITKLINASLQETMMYTANVLMEAPTDVVSKEQIALILNTFNTNYKSLVNNKITGGSINKQLLDGFEQFLKTNGIGDLSSYNVTRTKMIEFLSTFNLDKVVVEKFIDKCYKKTCPSGVMTFTNSPTTTSQQTYEMLFREFTKEYNGLINKHYASLKNNTDARTKELEDLKDKWEASGGGDGNKMFDFISTNNGAKAALELADRYPYLKREFYKQYKIWYDVKTGVKNSVEYESWIKNNASTTSQVAGSKEDYGLFKGLKKSDKLKFDNNGNPTTITVLKDSVQYNNSNSLFEGWCIDPTEHDEFINTFIFEDADLAPKAVDEILGALVMLDKQGISSNKPSEQEETTVGEVVKKELDDGNVEPEVAKEVVQQNPEYSDQKKKLTPKQVKKLKADLENPDKKEETKTVGEIVKTAVKTKKVKPEVAKEVVQQTGLTDQEKELKPNEAEEFEAALENPKTVSGEEIDPDSIKVQAERLAGKGADDEKIAIAAAILQAKKRVK